MAELFKSVSLAQVHLFMDEWISVRGTKEGIKCQTEASTIPIAASWHDSKYPLTKQMVWKLHQWKIWHLLKCRQWIKHYGVEPESLNFFFFISWRLIILQYCSGFCHILTWISHGFTCIPHPNPPSHLPLYPIPLGLPSAPGPSTCLIIQSEVSQKDEDQYSILTHIYGI